MRFRLSALLAVVLTTSYLPATAQDRAASFVSTSSELVVLPVTVSNKQGGFVADLPQDRFVVFDNGRRQEVALFSNEDTPVTVGLVIDSSGSMKAKLPEVIIAAATFKRRSNPQDEMFVVAFNDTVVERGAGPASPASDEHALESDLRSLVAQGRTALYDGLSAALDRMALATRPRKALIVVSDGARQRQPLDARPGLDDGTAVERHDLHRRVVRRGRSRQEPRGSEVARAIDRRRSVSSEVPVRARAGVRANRPRASERLHDRLPAAGPRRSVSPRSASRSRRPDATSFRCEPGPATSPPTR